MDSYTDVSEQCCGRTLNRVSCSPSSGSCGHSHCRQHDSMAGVAYPYPQTWNTAPSISPARPSSGCAGMMPDFTSPEFTMPDYPLMGKPYPTGMGMCTDTSAGPLEQNYPIAMAYVPWQQWSTPYPTEKALYHGTIFPELDLEFIYGRCSK